MREHPSEGTLQALLDGELPRTRRMFVRAHMLRCAACRARVEATTETASLVNSLLRAFALVREAQAHPATELLRDACCSDHDGGDMNDDGLLTLSTIGEKVTVVIVYEDVDHSGTFTQGDIVRYVSTVPHSSSAPQSAR